MRLVFISDTHLKHQQIVLPPGDVLVHAGDCTMRGSVGEVQTFLDWFAAQPHPHKVLIAGNHDFLAEKQPALFQAMLPDNIHYLNDSGVVVGDLRFWGSPVTPWFFDWAFNRERGADIRRHWDLIPTDTDVLITHGPPYGILDEVVRNPRPVGCRDLLKRCEDIGPRAHVFGHIHEGYGQIEKQDTLYVNASVLNEKYKPVNRPVVWDFSAQPKWV